MGVVAGQSGDSSGYVVVKGVLKAGVEDEP